MKHFLLPAFLCLIASCCSPREYDITDYGARTGRADNAAAINRAISRCTRAGGGKVIVPEGTFMTGTVVLKSGVTLHLDKGAIILGTGDLSAYRSMESAEDLSKYDSGDGTVNSNNSKDTRWNRALILAVGEERIAIEGEGTIDGAHVFDPEGEESMRGPHTVLFSGVSDFSLSGISIRRAANYAFMAYDVHDGTFSGLTVTEGWDGIHIRGGERIVISDCSFKTGDDAIAGGYWEGMRIHGCDINTSCNGIRIIMPVRDVLIDSCRFRGPGEFPHRTSGERRRRNMLAALNLQPGGWGKAPGDVDGVTFRDITADSVATPLMMTLNEGNRCGTVIVENLKATGVYGAAMSVESWKGGQYDTVRFKNISVQYVGAANPALRDLPVGPPPADWRPLPCWGLYSREVKHLRLENVSLSCSGTEYRPAFLFENVGEVFREGQSYSGETRQ